MYSLKYLGQNRKHHVPNVYMKGMLQMVMPGKKASASSVQMIRKR